MGAKTSKVPAVLSIAGSDSGGGAGIQADIKAIARCGAHGMTAITALTAQSTVGVSAVESVSPEMIREQVKAVAEDIGVDAVKVGMLGDASTIEAVAAAIDMIRDLSVGKVPVVVDPVMVAESGASLLAREAVEALCSLILTRATVVTPNIPEARALTGADEDTGVADLARLIHRLGPEFVVVTGGHSRDLVDHAFDGSRSVEIPGERHAGADAHGSGCTHSSVLAARLAFGDSPLAAARVARRLAAEAVANGLRGLGAGPGPVDILGLSLERDTYGAV